MLCHASHMADVTYRPDAIEVLLFDLGGVVVDIDFGRCFAGWAQHAGCDVDDLAARFSFDAAYRAHERGELAIDGYLDSLRQTLGIDLTDDQLLAGWNDIYVGVNPGIGPLLTAANESFPLDAFTNSNPTHQAVWAPRFADALRIFRTTYVSSEIGHRKPDPSAFEHVAGLIGVLPGAILFFDDSSENVVGAREAGMPAVHVTSTESVRTALAELGVIVGT